MRLIRRFRSAWPLATLLASAAVYFGLMYWTDPTRQFWSSWVDQSYYLRIATDLSSWRLAGENFLFGVGYPLTGVPSLWLGIERDPFFLFNLAAFVFVTYGVFQVGRRMISPIAGWVAAGLLVFASPLVGLMYLPWNSTVCIVAMVGVLLMASRERRGLAAAAIAGALVAWAFAARYVDMLWLLPLALAALWTESWRASLKPWLVTGAVALVLALPVLALHDKHWGSPLNTPYSRDVGVGHGDQGLQSYSLERVPRATVGLLVGSDQAAPLDDNHRGLLTSMFWMVLALPGAFLLLRSPGRNRLIFGTLVAVTLLGSLFYLSYRASEPDKLKFGTTHYFKMFWPGLSLMAAAALVAIPGVAAPQKSRRRRRA